MVLTRRHLPGPAGDGFGLILGRVTRVSPLYVTVDGREYGPVILTLTAAAATLMVGHQVLVAPSADDNDRLIVIDGVA